MFLTNFFSQNAEFDAGNLDTIPTDELYYIRS